MAVHTGIAPDVWRRQTDIDIATAIHLLLQQANPDNEPGQGYSG